MSEAVFLLQPWVRDLHINAIEFLDLSAVWFDRSMMPGALGPCVR